MTKRKVDKDEVKVNNLKIFYNNCIVSMLITNLNIWALFYLKS